MFNNGTLQLEEFPMSTIPCFQTAMIGWYMCFIMVFTGIANSILLVILLGNKELRQPINIFVIAITILNLIGSILELPFIIGSSFACRYTDTFFVFCLNLLINVSRFVVVKCFIFMELSRWIFQHVGCTLSAYIYYFVGCASVYLMTAISMER